MRWNQAFPDQRRGGRPHGPARLLLLHHPARPERPQKEQTAAARLPFIASIGIHVLGMSIDEAQRRFVQDCKQDEASARQQAIRGTFDPRYFAYTPSKLQSLQLRAEAQLRRGARFDLQRFHDSLLAHGAPPLALIRVRMLAEQAAP